LWVGKKKNHEMTNPDERGFVQKKVESGGYLRGKGTGRKGGGNGQLPRKKREGRFEKTGRFSERNRAKPDIACARAGGPPPNPLSPRAAFYIPFLGEEKKNEGRTIGNSPITPEKEKNPCSQRIFKKWGRRPSRRSDGKKAFRVS